VGQNVVADAHHPWPEDGEEGGKVATFLERFWCQRLGITINDTYDFTIGRALRNLPALREVGFAANRRVLHVESLSHDCLIG